MCYFVFLRSEDFDNMQYKNLIDLIDSLVETSQSRKQSTTRKNRPESSSPDKLKLRNQTKSNPSTTQGDAKEKDDDEEYSEEEIADDPDQEGDSQVGISKPPNEVVAQVDASKNTNNVSNKKEEADDDDDDDDGYDNLHDVEEFEDSPRQKLGSQNKVNEKSLNSESDEVIAQQLDDHQYDMAGNVDDEEDDEDVDEDEVIDVAESIFIRIAEQIINQQIK